MSKPIRLSASRGAPVLGISGFKTQVAVWQEIMEELHPGFNASKGYEFPIEEENPAMRWGTAFEDAIMGLAESDHGTIDHREQFFSQEFTTCHIDGQYSDGANHEGKTTNIYSFREKWGEPGTDKIPAEYQVQVQHQMIVSGAKKTRIGLLVFPNRVEEFEKNGISAIIDESGVGWLNRNGNTMVTASIWAISLEQMGYFHIYEIDANPETQGIMLEAYREFWKKNILGQIPPESQDFEDIRRLFPDPAGIIVATEQIARFVNEYVDLGHEIGTGGNLAKRRDQLKTIVIDWARKQDPTVDENAEKKLLIQDSQGNILATYNGKTFRGRD